MANQTDGKWGEAVAWPLLGIHVIMMQDGRILTFGTNENGMQGAQTIYDVYDPTTGEHTTLPNSTPTDIFCSAAIIIPGTNQILISGGDARPLGSTNKGVSDVNIFDTETLSLTPSAYGDMEFQRWYPTMVSLPDGRVVILGGRDINGGGIATPEIFTAGEGWKTLDGATDSDLGSSPLYARAFVNKDGHIVYFSTGKGNDNKQEVMVLDPDGDGSISEMGELPFSYNWDSPAIMFEPGKILMEDRGGKLWVMDINGDAPTFTQSAALDQDRNWSDMTVLADGSVLITGGTSSTQNKEAGADHTAVIWHPDTGLLSYGVDEDNPRLYHSTTILLTDGSVLSTGGGAGAGNENNYLDGQIYKPPYLFDENGDLAQRPEILEMPDHIAPGETFIITVDDAASIDKLTFSKTGAATHSFNMEARIVELQFSVLPDNQLQVSLPDVAGGVVAGSWMLFAWNDQGVPSMAPIIDVDPVFNTGSIEDPENMLTNGSFETAIDVDGSQTSDYMFGWESSLGAFEIWKDGTNGINASDGQTFIEVDGRHGTISQSVDTKAGENFDLSFDYSGNPQFQSTSAMEVLWNGQVVETVIPFGSIPNNYNLSVTGTSGEDVLAFRSIETTGDIHGGLLDNVILKPGAPTTGDIVNDIPDETQFLTGVGDNDIFVIAGNSSDYGWGESEDGLGIVIWNDSGYDLLYGFESIQFSDMTISLVVTGNSYTDIANVTQFINGTSETESFVIDGNSSDYQWGPTEDDAGIVVWGPTGVDLLYDIEKLVFNDTEIDLIPTSGLITADDPDVSQYQTGSEFVDKFTIDGVSTDYNWAATEDGEGTVVWNLETDVHDVLWDYEEIVFTDVVVDLG